MGILRWTPAEFWQATPCDLTAAIRGYLESKGVDPDAASKKVDVHELRRMLDDEPLHSPSIKRR